MIRRGTQQHVKPVEVSACTVYVRSDIKQVDEDGFTGWEYDEDTYPLKEYIERLTSYSDVDSIALLLSLLIGEVDFLRSRIEALEGAK